MSSADYHIYFHGGCFDGAMSAALVSHFLKQQGYGVTSFSPCRYQPDFARVWNSYSFQTPAVIVDFRYHPQAEWWFDHHQTTFSKPEWQAEFIADRRRYFDSRCPSCFGMTLNFLKKTYQYESLPILQELEPWVDKVDSANYQSAEEALAVDSWVKELVLLLDGYDKINPDGYDDFQRQIIKAVTVGTIRELLPGAYRPIINELKDKLASSLDLYRQRAVVKNKVSFTDQTDQKIVCSDFVGYYLFPELPYTVSVGKNDLGHHLHVGRNPWHEPKSALSLGELMKKYGGGGHENVGGGEVANRKEALKIIGEVIEYLNEHG